MLLPLLLLLAGPAQAPDPVCSVDVRWAAGDELRASRASPIQRLTVFGMIGSGCVPAQLSLTVAWFDVSGALVCSGTVDQVATQTAPVAMTNLDVNTTSLFEVVRWRNGPRPASLRAQPVRCFDAEGVTEIQPGELDRATSLRLYATLTGRYSAAATAELRIALLP